MNEIGKTNADKAVVEIYGVKYTLKGVQDIEQIQQAAKMVDEQIQAIMKQSRYLSPDRAAVLAALHLAEQYINLKKDYEEFWHILNENRSTGNNTEN